MNSNQKRCFIARKIGGNPLPKHNWDERDDRRYFICSNCAEYIGWGDYREGKGVYSDECANTDKDFPNDLNAMKMAEHFLDEKQRLAYVKNLLRSSDLFFLLNADSEQRADAFIKVFEDEI
jgi:hypothetical protein